MPDQVSLCLPLVLSNILDPRGNRNKGETSAKANRFNYEGIPLLQFIVYRSNKDNQNLEDVSVLKDYCLV